MGTIIIISIILFVLAVLFIFVLGAGRVTARSEQRAYVQRVLHNVEVRGQVDYIERNW